MQKKLAKIRRNKPEGIDKRDLRLQNRENFKEIQRLRLDEEF